jgi:glutamine synthetase
MTNVSEIYGSMVFDERVMKERLPKETYKELMKTINNGEPLNSDVANVVAHAMKEWAIENGATHFTHWFQPLSGVTSEKHDAFINPQSDGSVIMTFSGKELIQGEPDASSFPNGGLRATFEARGYTAWDPTSHAFIKDEVLCIPTAFCSYTGEALDKKTPLLRSMVSIEEQAKRVLAIFGESPERVTTTVGAEQEFFLISKEDYERREDLVLTGRTLFGHSPCKGQELEEHYFGAIRPTVNNFLKALDDELWKLGIPARTKHNEVAPAQHELAPIFANSNQAIDQNLLTMEEMTTLASRYGLVCLLHEKPFDGVNGSGKHNNWAISADSKNLLDPGDNPTDNMRFLVFLTAIIEAVDEYQELLRMSVATAGNDHRLGANEAPPAIISIFLGDELGAIVDAIINGEEYVGHSEAKIDLGVQSLPLFQKDNTDRNRTSPFAFTGNKFEFRMPGSHNNLADCNTVLNTAVAKSLKNFADELEGASDPKAATTAYIKKTLTEHQRIIFNGNGYADEWEVEAEKRGLANNRNTAEALPAYIAPKSIELFGEMGVLSESEIHSRYECKLERYCKLINIEARVMRRMTRRTFVPAISNYANQVASNLEKFRATAPSAKLTSQETLLNNLLESLDKIDIAVNQLDEAGRQALALENLQERADFYAATLIPIMDKLREVVDYTETITDRSHWPVPSYNNMLFYV